MRTLIAVVLISAAVVATAAKPVAITWQSDPAPAAVEVDGVPTETLQKVEREVRGDAVTAPRILAVFVEPANGAVSDKTVMPAVAGSWRIAEERVRFEPHFPWARGVRYRAEYRPGTAAPVVSFFEVPPDQVRARTEVVQVFPTAGVLPENQLKFYVQFSAPMSRGGTYEHVHIRDAQGQVIDLPFLELDEELWDPAMTRLTLLIDPGRIKRGVKPLEDIGPVFEAGQTYSLTIEAACRDGAGQPLRRKFEKTFRIGPADRTPPDPQRWRIDAPKAGTRNPR